MFLLIVGYPRKSPIDHRESTKSKVDFYTAGHGITPLQNGLAIAATSFRGGVSRFAASSIRQGLTPRLRARLSDSWPIVLS